MFTSDDAFFMHRALALAQSAADLEEVPVGAVVTLNNEIVGEGFNCPIKQNDPTAHAEMIALRNAATKIGNYRLINCKLYVTLEPCAMCAGAMVHARIKQLIYGATDPKTGVILSQTTFFNQPFLNHQVDALGGLYATECGKLLSDFFIARRRLPA